MNTLINMLDWQKMAGLIPAVVQDQTTQKVLMLGYMNIAALKQTIDSKRVTFYSRKSQALWVKGETSGNHLELCDIYPDCDNDSLLVIAKPKGPTCHQGSSSCFGNENKNSNIITQLEEVISQRQTQRPSESYVAKLFGDGIGRIAQKVGEEGVEVALAAAMLDKQQVCEEVADLVFHVLVLLRARESSFTDVLDVLTKRAFFKK
jgi:phosphoribosyl-AMP cyclohydrolase / phosphoribosyl-ATP pyrophosphohydrolase